MGGEEAASDVVQPRSRDTIVDVFQEYIAEKEETPGKTEVYEETALTPQEVNTAFSEPDEQGRYDGCEAYRNLAWCAGVNPHEEIYSVDGDAELIEHDVRGIQYELGRVPTSKEIKDGIHGGLDSVVYKPSGKYDSITDLREGLDMPPYEEFSVPADVEDAVVDSIFEGDASLRDAKDDEGFDAVQVVQHYLPWVSDRQHDTDQIQQELERHKTTTSSGSWFTKDEVVSLYTLGRLIDTTLQETEEDYQVTGRHRLPHLAIASDNRGDFVDGINDWFAAIVESLPAEYSEERGYSTKNGNGRARLRNAGEKRTASTDQPAVTGDGAREQRAEYAKYTACLDYFEGNEAAEQEYHYWLNRIGPMEMAEQIDAVVHHILDEVDDVEQWSKLRM